jgi:N-sulfoglucosamine sulfohydrolase
LPEYKEKLMEMRTALSKWQLEVKDLGFVPESDLVNMMWPGMVQPETAKVEFQKIDGKMVLTSPTEGASIAYQVDDEIGGKRWRLYHEPIPEAKNIAARAVRIGYKTSEISHFK